MVLCSFQGEGGPSLRLCFEGRGCPFVLSTVKGRAPLLFKGTGGVWAFLRVLKGGAPSFVVEVKWAGPAPFYLPNERAVPSFLGEKQGRASVLRTVDDRVRPFVL